MRPGLKVLLVDDHFAARITLCALLEDHGWQVTQAESVAEGRSKLQAGCFELVVLDLQLADGLGTELVPLVKARHPQAVTVMMSGHNPQPVEGVAAFLSKSAGPPELLRGLEAALVLVQAEKRGREP